MTIGQDVYFHPGEYRPGTKEGDTLIAHELAHTRQTQLALESGGTARARTFSSRESLEANADALAAGRTAQVLPAPAGLALLAPAVSETTDQSARRMAADAALRHALAWILYIQRERKLWPKEKELPDKSIRRGEWTVSRADRDARVALVREHLIVLIRLVEKGPVPAAWFGPLMQGKEFLFSYESTIGPDRTDAVMFYTHWAFANGRGVDDIIKDYSYIADDPLPGGGGQSIPIDNDTTVGWVTVADPKSDPHGYRWVTGYEGWAGKGVILDVKSDNVGYYYRVGGQKIYIPGPPR